MSHERPSQSPSSNTLPLPSWLIVLTLVAVLTFAWWQNNHASQSSDSIATGDPSPKTVAGANHSPENLPDEDEPSLAEVTPEHDAADHATTRSSERLQSTAATRIDSKTNPNSSSMQSGQRVLPPGSRNGVVETTPPNSAKPTGSDRLRPSKKSDRPSYLVENQTIRDLYGKIVYQGEINLKPTLDRIERGETNRHRNDGTSFQNREGRLPRKPAGYYKEYVHPTPGESGPGPQRIIIGQEGEIWYTGDHYKTFKKIKS